MSHHTRAIPRSVRAGTQFVRLPALLALAVGSATAAHAQASELDFGVLAGHWTDERIVERWGLDTACHNEPLWVHPDGLLVAWDARYGAPEVRAEVQCAADGSCSLLSAPDRQPPGLRLTADAGRLAFCTGAECIPPTYISCAGASVPPNLLAAVSRRPAPPELLTALPPGLYVSIGVETAVVPTGPDLLEACFAEPAAVWPDGVQIGLAQAETDAGVQYEVIYTETCTASGEPDWPLTCSFEDAFVVDPEAATDTYLARLVDDAFYGPVIEVDVTDDPDPYRVAMLPCIDDAGVGINLDFDPRGAVLLSTLDGLRPPDAPRLRLGR